MPEISINPEPFYIGGINIGLSVVMAWGVIAVITVALLFARRAIARFEEKPRGLQNALEMLVEAVDSFSQGKVGHYAHSVAPAVLTLMCYVLCTTIIEMLGLPPATEDINCTLGLGLCAFLFVNYMGFRARGFRGRMRSLASPTAIAFPFRVLIDCISPVTLGIRLFANVLVGAIIMKLIYAVVPIILPAAVASYFNVLHVGIQTYVFGLLTLIYLSEALE